MANDMVYFLSIRKPHVHGVAGTEGKSAVLQDIAHGDVTDLSGVYLLMSK